MISYMLDIVWQPPLKQSLPICLHANTSCKMFRIVLHISCIVIAIFHFVQGQYININALYVLGPVTINGNGQQQPPEASSSVTSVSLAAALNKKSYLKYNIFNI